LTIVTPEGFERFGEPIAVGEGVSDVVIPLRQAGLKENAGKAVAKTTVATVTGGVAVIALLAGLVFNGFAALTQAAAVRSLERTFRRQKSQELELAMAQDVTARLDDLREHLSSSGRAWREIAEQLLTDAGVAPPEGIVLSQDESFVTPPYFAISGGGNQYMFTTDPNRAHRRDRVVPLDAATVSPFARVEAHALWAYLTEQDLPAAILSRNIAWYVIVRRSSSWNWDPKKWQLKGLPNSLAGMRRRIAYTLIVLLVLGVVAFVGVRLYRYADIASLFDLSRDTVELKTESGISVATTPALVPSPTLTPATVTTPTVTMAMATATPVTTTAVTTTAPVAHTAKVTATITGTRGALLRVRAQPGGEVTGHLPEGTQTIVLEGPVLQGSTDWYLVQMPDDTRGWVAGDYVVFRDE
jgi:hypothetical protein